MMRCSYTVVLMRLIIINNQMSDEFHSPLTLILFFNICVSISCHGLTHSFIYPESDCRVFYLKLEWLRSGSAAKDFVKWVDDHNLGRVSLQERGKQIPRTRWEALVRRSMTRGRLQIASAKRERLVRRFGRSACVINTAVLKLHIYRAIPQIKPFLGSDCELKQKAKVIFASAKWDRLSVFLVCA